MKLLRKEDLQGSDGTFRPQLTSLVDVMTILLVFLIKSFSVEGNLITPAADLKLPTSVSKEPLKPRFTFSVTENSISFEGEVIAATDQFVKSDSMNIEPLYNWIMDRKMSFEDTSALKEVMIQADRELEFNVIKRVMFTCSKAGFTEYSVMVDSEG